MYCLVQRSYVFTSGHSGPQTSRTKWSGTLGTQDIASIAYPPVQSNTGPESGPKVSGKAKFPFPVTSWAEALINLDQGNQEHFPSIDVTSRTEAFLLQAIPSAPAVSALPDRLPKAKVRKCPPRHQELTAPRVHHHERTDTAPFPQSVPSGSLKRAPPMTQERQPASGSPDMPGASQPGPG